MKKHLIFIIVGLLNCSISAQDSIPEQDESFDPLQLNESFLPFMDGSMIYEIITGMEVRPYSNEVDSVKVVEKMGWKVQVFSTDDFYKADTVYKELVGVFGDKEVEKVFNAPYYKIRVGNCVVRENAEKLLNQITDLGYQNAWIIRTNVKVKGKVFSY
jgi:hypothetical protein